MTDLLDEEGRNEAERRFLRVLVGVAPGFDVWTYYPQLVTTVVVCDPDTPVVLRTLRVDFDGTSIRCGHDPSGQIDPAMASNDPDGYECRDALTPEQFAEVAGEWFWRQFRRPIDRYEWRGRDPEVGPYWVLADCDRGLVVGGRRPLSLDPPMR